MVKKAATKEKAQKNAKVPAKKPIEKPQKPASPVAQKMKQRDGPKWRMSDLKMG